MHLRQRYYERFLQKEWKKVSYCDRDIKNMINESTEYHYQNNTSLVAYFLEKYNTTKIRILIHKNGLCFICVRDESIKVADLIYNVVTCYLGLNFYSVMSNTEATMKILNLKKQKNRKPMFSIKCDY